MRASFPHTSCNDQPHVQSSWHSAICEHSDHKPVPLLCELVYEQAVCCESFEWCIQEWQMHCGLCPCPSASWDDV